MPKVYASSVIAVPVERVWDYIRDFNSLPKWFPGVTDSHLEGNVPSGQSGCVRNFGLPGGGRMREELLEFSEQDRRCVYKMLDGAVPMSRYKAGVRLLPVTDDGSTFAELTAEFECAPGHENEVAAFLGSTYKKAFDGIKSHFKKP
jgi:polyketide cyclase/dehydrase/lipid transport protein